jgi:hypothetical protein
LPVDTTVPKTRGFQLTKSGRRMQNEALVN